nr:TraB/GumN family protein [uncultured Bacteroides sp.]
MHNVERTFLDSISGFKKAFKTAKQIAIECDAFTQDSINRSKPRKTLKDHVFMPKDTTYAMIFSRNDFQFIDSTLKKYTPDYSKYKPMFWNNLLTSMAVIKNIKNVQSTLDGFILMLGYQNNKRIHFMETLESIGQKWTQFDSLSYAMDLHYQAKELQNSLKYPDKLPSFLNKLKSYYHKQELNHFSMDFLAKQMKIEDEPDFVFENYKYTEFLLVATRNEEWMKNILPMIQEDSSLIAVGAVHLVGASGLIAKLRNLGYHVEPVK